uniref:Uncharacterized protein n=1 Tax=Arundo donax TaxID=35708 RepID=A0A0A9B2K0_ARUDO
MVNSDQSSPSSLTSSLFWIAYFFIFLDAIKSKATWISIIMYSCGCIVI